MLQDEAEETLMIGWTQIAKNHCIQPSLGIHKD
jgi:hypothetical protein